MTDRTLHRSIIERWVITATLEMETPAHFGNGDADPLTDMPLLLDEAEGRPLLPGTSIAGALRNYLRERESGYGKAEANDSLTSLLFGSSRTSEDGKQSPLIIDDALGTSAGFELRDGVAIDSETRTAADDKKFDMQLLAAGSAFALRFELIVSNESQKLRDALLTALNGFETGEITLGARKRRGFGQCVVKTWHVIKFDLQTKEGLLDWLGYEQEFRTPKEQPGANLAAKLGSLITEEKLKKDDKRSSAHLIANFAIDGTLMVRSGFGETGNSPDTVHIRSARAGHEKPVPVIPGTSLAGVLRQRALKIARTVAPEVQANGIDGEPLFKINKEKKKIPLLKAEAFINGMFGPSEIKRGDKHAKASRVSVKETEIKDSTSLVVTRVKIDRFTGGAYESALFSEQPEIGMPNTQSVVLDLALRDPKDSELGLLLLLLKDLWIGDLPIGGESSVGRGRLQGIDATLEAPATIDIPNKGNWFFKADNKNVLVTESINGLDAVLLEKWVKAFEKEVKEAKVSHV